MGFLGLFFKFLLECFDILAWPLIALCYPLCASIQAIETDSNSDTQKLIAYWICFSFILLFEQAFLKLLLWLPYWTYIKLAIVGCLVTPHFDGSFYVFKYFVHPCLSMDRFVELREFFKTELRKFFKTDELLFEVNRDAKETGADSLENLVSFKPEFVEPELVQKDNNAVEITEKKGLTSTNQVGQIKLAVSENRTYEALDIKEITPAMVTSRDLPEVLASKNIQKEWTCAQCQVTTTGEANLILHLNGRKHKNAGEKLTAKKQTSKSKVPETLKSPKNKEIANAKVAGKDVSVNSHFKGTLNPWTCALCQVTTTTKTDLVSHFQGKRHEHALKNLKAKIVEVRNCKWWCTICNISCTSEGNMDFHLNGRKHSASPLRA